MLPDGPLWPEGYQSARARHHLVSFLSRKKQGKRRTTYEGTTQIKLFDIVAVDRTGEFGEVDMAIDHRRATAQSASSRLQMKRNVHALR